MTGSKASTTNPFIISHLRQLIYYHLDCNLLRNALFLAGRLHAYEPRSSEAAYLLALCHLRVGQLKAAYDYSRNSGSRGTHLGCSYVFAQACLGLERYVEGANALDKSRALWFGKNGWGKHTDSRRQHLPDAAAVFCLKGKLWQGHSEHNKAIESYAEALKANPFMWDAFTGLCDLGVHVRTPNIFKMTHEMMSSMAVSAQEEPPLGKLEESPPSNPLSQSQVNINTTGQHPSTNDPFSISKNRVNEGRTNAGSLALYEKLNGARHVVTPIINNRVNAGEETPTTSGNIMDPDFFSGNAIGGGNVVSSVSGDPPFAPARKARAAPGMSVDINVDAPPKMHTNATMRSKSRSKGDSDDRDGPTLSRSSTMSHGSAELKRTVSGKAPPSVASSTRQDSVDADPGAPQRRSVRLFNQIRPQSGRFAAGHGSVGTKEGREVRKAKAPGTKPRNANTLNVGRVVSGNRKHGDLMDIDAKEQRPISSNISFGNSAMTQKPLVNDKAKEHEALQSLLELFTKLGTGYFALSHYQCQDALRCFNSVPATHRETPWVLAQIGRAQFEQASYQEAEKTFSRLKAMVPSRTEDMEVYSTALWHLKEEIGLAFLAHETNELDRNSPQAWCAVGNSFSLQRDHDQALKCFKRATQLDPKFAYAYTLQGHEHIGNEEYEKAMQAFRAAISAENRHYNAWYGLGKVFEKQGKYAFAEQHYRTAASINPTNAVLITCIGSVLEKVNKKREALVQYTRACELAEKSALCRFKKAKVLMALAKPEEALTELRLLKDIAPDEANVHFLLGTVYKALRQKGSAVRHFTMALNLDPKAWPSPLTLLEITLISLRRHRITSKKSWSRWRTTTTKMMIMMTRACDDTVETVLWVCGPLPTLTHRCTRRWNTRDLTFDSVISKAVRNIRPRHRHRHWYWAIGVSRHAWS